MSIFCGDYSNHQVGDIRYIAQLTDKRDPMYYTSKRPSESHNDGHPKNIRVAILDFGKKGKKPLFQLNFALAQFTDKWDPIRVR